MKFNKKLLSLSAAAIMAVSAVSASAATLPTPKDNNDAFRLAESFYYDGLYYEAKEELAMVDDNAPGYDEAKAIAWAEKIDSTIAIMEKKNLLKLVQKYNDAGLIYEAAEVLDELNSRDDITLDDYYSISWWEGVIADKIAKLENAELIVVRSGESAIQRVKAAGYKLTSEYEWYSPVKVDGGYDVYIKTQLPGGGSADVDVHFVNIAGEVDPE